MEKAMDNAKENKKEGLKFMIYSAHDDDLSAFLNFLEYSLNSKMIYPNYASQLSIELYSSNSKYIVKLLFDGVEILDQLEYSEFKEKVDEGSISDSEIEDFCVSKEGAQNYNLVEKKSNFLKILLIVLISIFGLIIIISGIFIYKLCKSKIEVEDILV
eukprot:CAMPEP_0170515376 /NCGR_PEP_ID=MMETSP0209-20121228/1815_1 /TAXON_ID=665100 ORGANISM="Litonotus pictus, Strain P1" /NCGR_SAMPLE_ID=MMETSP0209 /ASSEMBLY_ACC=CAM_ASM_000301 /LENGTH=157 /DNA_ID=CAMNT_0010799833 /DNA_START=964 /DNA_END=1437 /DNA_ORIENTATION=+